jgi:streptogramin lyase
MSDRADTKRLSRSNNYVGGLARGILALALPLLGSGCCEDEDRGGETENPLCQDSDGDGFGLNCNGGADCNDFNPLVVTCSCSEGNFPGCDCEDQGATEACFSGVAELAGVGACTEGVRTCDNGKWTPCVGETPPLPETCNDRDDDCNGVVDDGLELGPCGTCDRFCDMQGVGGDSGNNWDPEATDGLVTTPDGGLQLNSDGISFTFLYVANSEEGTVSKVNTVNGNEEARYVSALNVASGQPSPTARCGNNGNCPSRTAVDLVGNVWVANRAFGRQGSVTKIANKDCIDKNGNGTIETSRDVDGSGIIDMDDSREYFGADDECILFTVPVGGNDSVPRALAVDPFAPIRGVGSVWVGAHAERRYYQYDASDGSLIKSVDVPHHPYGAVMDRFGVLWSTDLSVAEGHLGLVQIISATGTVVGDPIPVPRSDRCGDAYGITIDGDDNVWVAGWDCHNASRYTPSTGQWMHVTFPGSGNSRGIAVDRDGWVYVGTSQNGGIVRFRYEDGSQMQFFDAQPQGGRGTIGVGLDFFGKVWGVNQSSDNTTRLDPATGQMELFPVGDGPYTYSDFTGYALRNFTAPQGSYFGTIEGCPSLEQSTVWDSFVWDAETPPGTGVRLFVRSAPTIEELPNAEEFGPFEESPANLAAAGVPQHRYLGFTIMLETDTPGSTPTLWSVNAIWTCPAL